MCLALVSSLSVTASYENLSSEIGSHIWTGAGFLLIPIRREFQTQHRYLSEKSKHERCISEKIRKSVYSSLPLCKQTESGWSWSQMQQRFYFSVVCHFPSTLQGVSAITAETEYFWWEEQRRIWFCCYVLKLLEKWNITVNYKITTFIFYLKGPLPHVISPVAFETALWNLFMEAPVLCLTVRLIWALLPPFTDSSYKEIIFHLVLFLMGWKLNIFVVSWGPFQSFSPLSGTFASSIGEHKLFDLFVCVLSDIISLEMISVLAPTLAYHVSHCWKGWSQ